MRPDKNNKALQRSGRVLVIHTSFSRQGLISGFDQADIGPADLPDRPEFATKRLEEAQDYLRSHDRSVCLRVGDGTFGGYSASFVRPASLGFSRTKIESLAGYSLFFSPREYCVNIPLKGSGWAVNGSQVISFSHKQALFVAPQCAINKHWQGSSEVITVHIPEQYLHSQQGFALPDTFSPVSLIERSAMADVIDLIGLLCRAATDRSSPLACKLAIESLERAIMIALLRCLPGGNDGPRVRSPAVPYYVRRADHYMRANFRPGVTLLDIARAVGVSERTLQYGFRNSYDMSPLQFFKRLRLDRARELLMAEDTTRTLAELGWEVGYQKPSHFASDYKGLFGEYPSQTRARCRCSPVVHAGC